MEPAEDNPAPVATKGLLIAVLVFAVLVLVLVAVLIALVFTTKGKSLLRTGAATGATGATAATGAPPTAGRFTGPVSLGGVLRKYGRPRV